MTAISVQGLTKVFRTRKGEVRAVDGVSFTVKEGEIFGLLGPNGAGKTTTLRMLATLLAPTAGRAEVMGYDLMAAPQERKRCGFWDSRGSGTAGWGHCPRVKGRSYPLAAASSTTLRSSSWTSRRPAWTCS